MVRSRNRAAQTNSKLAKDWAYASFEMKVIPALTYFLSIIAALLQLGILLVNLSTFASFASSDFQVFYNASQAMHAGHVRDIYSREVQQTFPGGTQQGTGGFFYHFPEELPLIYPLAFFGRITAFYLWTLLNLGACVVSCVLLPKNPIIPVPLLACAFFPTLAMISQGQDSGILLLLITIAFRFFTDRRDIACGLLLALALFKFQYAIPLVFALALVGYRKLAISFSLAALGIVTTLTAIMGIRGMASYVEVIRSHGWEFGPRMVNLRGLVEGIGAPAWLAILGSAAVLACFALLAGKLPDRAAIFAAAVAFSILVSYHCHIYDAVLLLIAASVVLRRESNSWIATLLAGSPAFIYLWTRSLLFLFALIPLAIFICALVVSDSPGTLQEQ
jgi:glycosyl transferase family 87